MNSIDETLLGSLFAMTEQKVIKDEILGSYNLTNPGAIRAAVSDAAWQGFCAGMNACKRYYETKGKE